MVRRGPVWIGGSAALAAMLSSCAPEGARPPAEGALRLSYEDVLAPEAFAREGPAIPEPADGAAGFWAVTPGLPRPERARVENLRTGAATEVALFAGPGGPGGAVRLSAEAADAIGLAAPGPVRVTALRREPRLAGDARPGWRLRIGF